MLSLATACKSKAAEDGARSAAGSGSGSASTASAGSGSAAAAGSATAPARRSASARGLEDFDRAFAPIAKLSGGAQLRALCTHRRVLDEKSVPLVTSGPTGSASWDEDARALVGIVGAISHGCDQIPKKAFASDEALVENDLGSAGELVKPLHEAFAKLIASVPDARPIDAHAGDPLPPADPPEAAVDLGHLRAALHMLDDAAVKLAASAKRAKSREQACKGVEELQPLISALGAPDIIAGPPNADDWSGHLGNLAMVFGDIVGAQCSASATEPVAGIADRFDTFHQRVGALLAMCK